MDERDGLDERGMATGVTEGDGDVPATDDATAPEDGEPIDEVPSMGGRLHGLLRAKYVVTLIVLVIGCVWSISAMGDGAARLDRMTSTASGTVADVKVRTSEDDDGDKRITYRPIVSFEDSDHVMHEAKSLYASESDSHRVGQGVGVRYDPRDADAGCVIVGEEELARAQVGERGPLGIVFTICVATCVFILLP